MSKQRYVDTKFWDDNYIVECNPIEKLLYLYLLTNSLTNILGIYEISIRRIVFDTKIDKDMVIKILERFNTDNKIKYSNGYIAIKKFVKYQADNPKINKGIELLLKEVPVDLIKWIDIDFNRLDIKEDSLYIGLDKTSEDLNYSNPNPNPNIKEGQALLNKPKSKTDLLEFNFTDKCWYELTDWRIKKFQGKFPMLSINYLLEDEFKTKLLSSPKEYKEIIETLYKGNIEDLVWAWLGQAKKFYLKDHPDYKEERKKLK